MRRRSTATAAASIAAAPPLRVYARELDSEDPWVSVEDYLQAGSTLGHGMNWQFGYSGGELLMMGATGEPNQYYPHDSNGLSVASTAQACACLIQPTQSVCAPLGYGGCNRQDTCMGLLAFGFYGFCREKKKTYEMCVDVCKIFANAYCKGTGVGIDPWLGRICDLIAKKGCEALCKETNKKFKPFTECWKICPKAHKPGSPDCAECCEKLCRTKDGEVQRGGQARCFKECAIQSDPDE